jgi:PIN domain nuclease of toxin-antitoxin system
MLLLDTCTLLWLASNPAQLSDAARDAINDEANPLHVSAISAWEIGIAVAKNRLKLAQAPTSWFASAIAKYQVSVVDISWQIGVGSADLSQHHMDPADRIIIQTAMMHNLAIISPDAEFAKYSGARIIW